MSERSPDDDGYGSLSRRRFLELATSFGAVAVLGRGDEALAAAAGRLEQQVVEGDPWA